jgi:hypothetical protein
MESENTTHTLFYKRTHKIFQAKSENQKTVALIQMNYGETMSTLSPAQIDTTNSDYS